MANAVKQKGFAFSLRYMVMYTLGYEDAFHQSCGMHTTGSDCRMEYPIRVRLGDSILSI